MFGLEEKIQKLIGVLQKTSTDFREMITEMKLQRAALDNHRKSLDANTKALGGTPPRTR